MAVDELDDDDQVWDAFVPPGRGGLWPWSSALTGWIGLIALASAAAATAWWGVSHFENRLEQSVRAELQGAGINPEQLNFDWDYRDVSVTGKLDGATREQLLGAMREADDSGLRQIDVAIDAADEKPLELAELGVVDVGARLEEGKMVLQGTVLTAGQRDRLQAAAVQAIGAAGVVNEIVVSGLKEKTPGSDQRVDSLANSIAGLDQAESADARLSATDFRFNATVADETQANDLLRLRGNAGDIGLVISGDIVTRNSAPGGVVDITAVKENGRIVLTGVVTSEAQKQVLLQAATRAFDQQSVTDEIEVAEVGGSAATDRSVAVLASAINYFDEAIEADAHLTDEEFEFNALLEYEEDSAPFQAVRENAKDIGLDLTGAIEARQMSLSKEVSMLQAEINSLTSEIRENVIFESAKADLSFTAKQTLDKVVDAMNRYQRPVVEIAGHTDDSGPEDANQKLSLFRATAVLEYLKLSGIDGLRLRALGFGELLPIAGNSTEVGKKQNRRVEFTARGNFGN